MLVERLGNGEAGNVYLGKVRGNTIQWAAPDPATALGCAQDASAQVSGHGVRDTSHRKVWQKANHKNIKNACQIMNKIMETGFQEAPRGIQNQEKGVLGGILGPSWGALGTQMDPRWEKDDFFGLSPPSPDPHFFIVSCFFGDTESPTPYPKEPCQKGGRP